ncbi:unnamed protein product [Staurois parvus]|uniref:Secreted protein n=1 Tax=Staurois parvus TaxID=386267 RepID=A0ABN9AKX2_9NEOB|nr:unnamed protein product [Staurois parvus]
MTAWHWVRHWIVWLDSGHRGPPGIRSFGSTAGIASSGKAVGSESTGMTAGTRVRHWIVWLDSGHWVTRHQVIWLDSGHASSGKGSGLRVNRHEQ